jgi:uncharacterized membrane protein YjgN (DUF898 family)
MAMGHRAQNNLHDAEREACAKLRCRGLLLVVAALALGFAATASATTQSATKAVVAQHCGSGQYRWKSTCHRLKHQYQHCGHSLVRGGCGAWPSNAF